MSVRRRSCTLSSFSSFLSLSLSLSVIVSHPLLESYRVGEVFMADWHSGRCLLAFNWVVNAAHKSRGPRFNLALSVSTDCPLCFINGTQEYLVGGGRGLREPSSPCSLNKVVAFNAGCDKSSSELHLRPLNTWQLSCVCRALWPGMSQAALCTCTAKLNFSTHHLEELYSTWGGKCPTLVNQTVHRLSLPAPLSLCTVCLSSTDQCPVTEWVRWTINSLASTSCTLPLTQLIRANDTVL